MPFCGDCRNWVPPWQDDNDKNFLDIAYHDFECGRRQLDDWEGLLEGFMFEGDIMYEVDPDDGSWTPVSTYSEYPEPYRGVGAGGKFKPPVVLSGGTWGKAELVAESTEITQDMPAVKSEPGTPRYYSWEEWKALYPNYAASYIRADERKKAPDDRVKEYQSNGYHAGSQGHSHYPQTNVHRWKPPYEEVDRNKWPNLWAFLVKFHFLPNSYKDTKWQKEEPNKEWHSIYYGSEN